MSSSVASGPLGSDRGVSRAAPSVCVVAADPLVARGVAAVVEAHGLPIVETAADADVVIVDAAGPWLATEEPGLEWDAPTIALADDEVDARRALQAGAAGVLGRDAAGALIVAAVRAVSSGLVVLAPGPGATLLPDATGRAGDIEPLTPRETEVLGLLAAGLTNTRIARELGIAENTVKYHVASLLGKLRAESRTEAVVVAARAGLLQL